MNTFALYFKIALTNFMQFKDIKANTNRISFLKINL